LEAYTLEGNGLKILEDKGILAVTKPSSENIYTLLSIPEIQNKQVLGSDLPSEPVIREKLQKEAETFFSSISSQLPHEVPDRHIGIVVFHVRTGILKPPDFPISTSFFTHRKMHRGFLPLSPRRCTRRLWELIHTPFRRRHER
jgi:hypothetical protein